MGKIHGGTWNLFILVIGFLSLFLLFFSPLDSAATAPITCTITVSAGVNGAISPSGAVNVDFGTDQTFTITPDTGYHLVNVLVDGAYVGAVSSYTFTNVLVDHTISAAFAPSHSPTTVFTDGTFNIADWELRSFYDGVGGSVTASQPATGGNPGAYRRFVNTVNNANGTVWTTVWGSHRLLGAQYGYDPQLSGAIKAIDFEVDAACFTGAADCQNIQAVLYQNGKVYFGPVGFGGSLNAWRHMTAHLVQNDFYEVVQPLQALGGNHPDFSANGATMGFGFAGGNTARYGYTANIGFDNWKVTIHSNVAPLAATLEATDITAAGANLNGAVNPRGLDTSYRFEYGLTTAYGITTTVADAGSGNSDLMVRENLSGLFPGAVYHYRLIAANSDGTTVGPDRTFTMPGVAGVAYITVTPGANGTISPPGAAGVVPVNRGADQAFTIAPNSGYHIVDVRVDGVSVETRSSYNFTGVTGNHAIGATFDTAALANWHPISPLLQSNQLNAAAYGKNIFVAVGNSGTIVTSANGTDWTVRTSGTSDSLLGIAYVNDIFVAQGFNGAILTSADGMTWSVKTPVTAQPLWGTAYGNNVFVTVGNAGTILTSADGSTWEARASGVSSQLAGIAYGSGIFVAVSTQNGVILTSADGMNWQVKASGIADVLRGIVYVNKTFVVMAYNGRILTSTDGLIWRVRSSGTSNDLVAATYGNNTFVAVGLNGTILTSTDAVTWTGRNTGTSKAFYGVACGNNTVIAVGQDGTILQSDLLPEPVYPETAISAGPDSFTRHTAAAFSFSSSVGAAFECQLDEGSYENCTSPKTYAKLTEGSHLFSVRALDSAGNTDRTPATFTWMVDVTAPSVTAFHMPAISVALTVPVTNFTTTDNVNPTGYMLTESDISPGAADARWTAAPPVEHTFTGFGTKTVYAWAKDAAGNVSPGRSIAIFLRHILTGDIDGNDEVELADAIITAKLIAGNNVTGETMYRAADVNGDGRINLPEMIYILQKLAGLR